MSNQAGKIVINSRLKDFKYLTVNWIAQKLKVSVPNLSRAFKQKTGKPLRGLILLRKIEISKDLVLKNPQITVKELAARLDYSSARYFIKVFKEHCLITPGTFIKLARISKGTYESLLVRFIFSRSFSGAKIDPGKFQKICDEAIKSYKANFSRRKSSILTQ